MKRVLVTGGANIGKAGVATMVYRWGQHFDSNKLVYDYLMQKSLPDEEFIRKIKDKGGRIFTIDENRKKNFVNIVRWIISIIKEYRYDTIHINIDSAYGAAVYVYAAKKGGCKHIFVHAHAAGIDENNSLMRFAKICLHKLCMPYTRKNTEKYMACSDEAAKFMFGNSCVFSEKYVYIPTSVDINKFEFSHAGRERIRKELCIVDKKVIVSIGRYSYQKNHKFLIDLFDNISKTDDEWLLLLVGDGPLKGRVKKWIDKKGINDKVMMLGNRKDIRDILSASDVMVITSHFEGMPIVAIEAQANGLPCLLSGNITKETKVNDNVLFIEGWQKKSWINGLLEIKETSDSRDVFTQYSNVYDIKNIINIIQDSLLIV